MTRLFHISDIHFGLEDRRAGMVGKQLQCAGPQMITVRVAQKFDEMDVGFQLVGKISGFGCQFQT